MNSVEFEREIEARLQQIPHHLDRRKFRGLIQRIRTFERKKALQEARESERERIAKVVGKIDLRKKVMHDHEYIVEKSGKEIKEEVLQTLDSNPN